MRSYDKYRENKFIQKSDAGKGILVTIDRITEDDVSMEDQPERIKFVIHFKENYKPWVPSLGSLEEIAKIAGTGDVDNWPGTVIVLYINPDVEHKGKRVGGIRCRAPKNQSPDESPASNQLPETETGNQEEDDIPF